MIDADLIRSARALLGLSQGDLAEDSGVAEITIKKIERKVSPGSVPTLTKIQTALEKRGVVFLEPGDQRSGGKGVRMRK